MSNVKYPEITVELIGHDGNAFAILGAVTRAMRKAKLPVNIINEFTEEATNGTYDHLLMTAMNWVNVE